MKQLSIISHDNSPVSSSSTNSTKTPNKDERPDSDAKKSSSSSSNAHITNNEVSSTCDESTKTSKIITDKSTDKQQQQPNVVINVSNFNSINDNHNTDNEKINTTTAVTAGPEATVSQIDNEKSTLLQSSLTSTANQPTFNPDESFKIRI